MSKHQDKSTGDGQGNFDPSRTKDVQEAGGGRHSGEDRGDEDDQRDQGDGNE